MRTKYKNISHLIRCKVIEQDFKRKLKELDFDTDMPGVKRKPFRIMMPKASNNISNDIAKYVNEQMNAIYLNL